LNSYSDIILTVKDVVTEDFYNKNNLQEYETIRIDSSTSILYVIYRFKIKDEKNNYFTTIGTMLSFERTSDATKEKYELWEAAYSSGLRDDIRTKEPNDIKAKELNDIISFGEKSQFDEYRDNEGVRGYHLAGRTKNITVSYSIVSNHIEHNDYIKIFKEKIKIIENM